MDFSHLDKQVYGNPQLPTNPKLSICLITYKHADYIQTCLDNILNQKVNFGYELLIGEDHSPDETPSIIQAYADQFPDRIKAFIRPENVGGKTNFLHCFLQCKGEYIIFIEGDDYWTDPQKLQNQVDFLDKNPHASACFHNAEILFEDGTGRANELINPQNQALWTQTQDLLKERETWFMATASVMMRSKYVQPLPAWFEKSKSGDIPMYVILAEKGPIGYIAKTMSVYRKNLGGQSYTDSNVSKSFLENRIYMYANINAYTRYAYAKQIHPILAEYHVLLMQCNENKDKFVKKIIHLIKAKSYQHPQNLKTLIKENLLSADSIHTYRLIKNRISQFLRP